MGATPSRDAEALQTARQTAEASWRWLGADRQEELYRVFYAFCTQQSDRTAIQKMALAFTFDIFKTRARLIVENLFAPVAKPRESSSSNNSGGGGASASSAATTPEELANNPDVIRMLYMHLGVSFSQMGLTSADITLFYDLFLEALYEVGDDALTDSIAQQRADAMAAAAAAANGGGSERGGGGGLTDGPQHRSSDGLDSYYSSGGGGEHSSGGGGAGAPPPMAGFAPVAPMRSDLTPQRPLARPQSGGGGSLRSRQHARAAGGGVTPSNSYPASAEPSPQHPSSNSAAANNTNTPQHHSTSALMLSGSNAFASSTVDVNGIQLRLQQDASLSFNPNPSNSPSAMGLGGAVVGRGSRGASLPPPQWTVREQAAWAVLLRRAACDATVEGHAKAMAAMAILTVNAAATGRCPPLRSPEGTIASPECRRLTELLYPSCYGATSFMAMQLRSHESYAVHACASRQEGAVPILERRMRYVTLRHRYVYLYDSSPQTNRIRVEEPIAIIDLEHASADVAVRVETSNGVDRHPMHAVVVSLQESGTSHTLAFTSTIQSGSWHEAISRAKAFFTTNPFFDAPALPPPPKPKPPTAAQLAAMGSATFADALPLVSEHSAGFNSVTRSARFLGIATATGAEGSSSSVGSGGGVVPAPAAEARRFDPNTDLDFAAAFRNSFPFKAKLGDFEFYELLGAGNFGRVVRCTHIYSRHVFALKIIRKERFKGIRNVLEVRRERKVLETADNPYIMRIHRTYQTRSRVYFLLDYLPGGELLRHTNKSPGHRFSEEFSKFVLAELACACEYMRVNNIVHRDIKGDNLVLDEHGHLILTDFGFAKHLLPGKRHKTCCGTLAYIAPEMLLSNNPEGYSYQVDWWSTGVVLFTVLTGYFPFLKSRRKDTIDAITTQPLQFPQRPAVSELPMDLCHKLLNKDPSKRCCSLAQIKAHPWYEGFDWAAVEAKVLPPPYQTLLHQPADPKAADAKAAEAPPAATPHDEVTLEQELKDAATVMYETADDVRREEDIFGSFLDAQEDAGSNREEDSGGSAADSDTDDEWNEGGSDNEDDVGTEVHGEVGSTMSGSIVMARPRGYSSSSLIR